MPITHETLINIGIVKPGHRARLLAHLLECQGKLFPTVKSLGASMTKSCNAGVFEFNCCALPRYTAEQPIFPSLESWLGSIGLEELYPQFIEAGYDDFEQILFLMDTNFSIND
jgi:hypothetical protein